MLTTATVVRPTRTIAGEQQCYRQHQSMMIPQDKCPTDQLRLAPSSSKIAVNMCELDCTCPSPKDKTVTTRHSQVQCSCCCRGGGNGGLRRLVPARAGVRRRRRHNASALDHALRRQLSTRAARSLSDSTEPAVPGDADESDRCVTDSTAASLSAGSASRLAISQQATTVTRSSANIMLPLDPRTWTRDQVHLWLRLVSMHFNIPDDVDTDRFLMNGKALCLMNMDMFLYRVPRGGDLLYRDFQYRLVRAVLINTAE